MVRGGARARSHFSEWMGTVTMLPVGPVKRIGLGEDKSFGRGARGQTLSEEPAKWCRPDHKGTKPEDRERRGDGQSHCKP